MKDLSFLLSTTLMYCTPLLFAAQGGLMSEKSGIINIGLEGMMTIGAFAASLVVAKTGNPWWGLMAGGMAGLSMGLLHAFACIWHKANQVVSGMAINFLSAGISVFLCRLFFDGTSMTPPLELEKKVPKFGGQYATVYLAFLVTFLIWFILSRTTWGLRLISVGEHPQAAEGAGLSVGAYRLWGVLTSGFLSGLGGAGLSIAIVSNFRPTLISGQGFIALAAMIFGRWKPIPTMGACLFFGFSQAMVVYLGGMESLNISSQLLAIFPYFMTLVALIGLRGKNVAPSALGAAN